MIQARLAASRRAAWVTRLVLGAALLRGLLQPSGELLSTAVFAASLLWIIGFEIAQPPEEARWGRGRAMAAGLLLGAVLLAPNVVNSTSHRSLAGFWSWAAIAAVIAAVEEMAIRGVLYRRWFEESGPLIAIVATSAVFALIHLPRYGFAAMPLDLSVGLALGGLRALSGRVVPCIVAHTMADWGAWFWS